jgi:RNA polymerase-binding transcription factor DksA
MSTTSALPEPSDLTAAGPAYRALLEEQWRAQVAEITRLSLDALDCADRDASRTEHLHVAAQLIAAARQQLEETEAALRRIDTGSYGSCVNCGKGIPAERLEVLPAARYCVPCQRAHQRSRR